MSVKEREESQSKDTERGDDENDIAQVGGEKLVREHDRLSTVKPSTVNLRMTRPSARRINKSNRPVT